MSQRSAIVCFVSTSRHATIWFERLSSVPVPPSGDVTPKLSVPTLRPSQRWSAPADPRTKKLSIPLPADPVLFLGFFMALIVFGM